jgi:GNAT superfamily N-acetyltransferase
MIKRTLYAEYLSERMDGEILESEKGFITYKVNGTECFIIDMFVSKKYRSASFGRDFINELCDIALQRGCNIITANVHLWDKGHDNTLIAAFKTGFKISNAENGVLIIYKKIGVNEWD